MLVISVFHKLRLALTDNKGPVTVTASWQGWTELSRMMLKLI